MSADKYTVIRDAEYGYRRLDPLPTKEEGAEFYRTRYYELVRQGGRAQELRRFMAGGQEAERERAWLSATLYADIYAILSAHANGRRILDIGCGTGELMLFLKEKGFDLAGIEPSPDAAALAQQRGLPAVACTLEEYAERHASSGLPQYAAVILLNVLEHVPNPVEIIDLAKRFLNSSGGLICVRVPNDFNELQRAAAQKLDKTPWWVAVPDHICYFDFDSLHALLEGKGFEVVHSQCDFPMESFLLMGEDYVGNPALGSTCHQKRIELEMSIPADVRRRIYCKLAEAGVGRNCLVVGRLRP